MDDKRLQEIKERAKKATPGVWDWDGGRLVTTGKEGIESVLLRKPHLRQEAEDVFGGEEWDMLGIGIEVSDSVGEKEGPIVPDLEFITHARQDIPDLLDEIERLKQELASK